MGIERAELLLPSWTPIPRFGTTPMAHANTGQTGAFSQADHNDQTVVWFSTFFIPFPCTIEAIGLNLETAPSNGASTPYRTLDLALYSRAATTGNPALRVANSYVQWQLPTSGFDQLIKTYSAPKPVILDAGHYLLASAMAPNSFTNGNLLGYMIGKTPQFTRAQDFKATVSGRTFAGGLPADWSTVSSPTYAAVGTTSGSSMRLCNALWTLYASEGG